MIEHKLTDEQRELVEANIPLAYLIANRTYHPHIEDDDAAQIALLGICKAACYYEPGKAKFTTLAGLAAQQMLWMEERRYKGEVAKRVFSGKSLDSYTPMPEGGECPFHERIRDPKQDTYKQAEALIALEKVIAFKSSLNERDKKIFECVVMSHMRQESVAKEMGLSQSYISRIAKCLAEKVNSIIGLEELA